MDLRERFETYRVAKYLRGAQEWFEEFLPDPLTWRMRWKRLTRRFQSAVLAFFKAEPAKQCGHVALRVVNAEVMKSKFGRDYGYQYWVAHVKCLDCPEEWKLQARTPGKYSQDPHSNVFRS